MWQLGHWLQTALVPNAWNTDQSIKYVATVVKTNGGNLSIAASEAKLLRCQRMMKPPRLTKRLQKFSVSDSDFRAFRELLGINVSILFHSARRGLTYD